MEGPGNLTAPHPALTGPGPAPAFRPATLASFRVLASGSEGNCSVLCVGERDARRVILIDAGLSPRRTRRMLRQDGLSLDHIEAVLLTHLDHDHWRIGWMGVLPDTVPVYMHGRHHGWASHVGILPPTARTFEGDFDLPCGVRVRPALLQHDDLGVAVYRFELPDGCSLGFATDVGRVGAALVEHFKGVGVLAIESNYCRDMQVESDRPVFLKRRIMGGRGHLSNAETAAAVEQIAPRHVVFLHLSRQCNSADLVADLHAGAEYEFTIADQHRPTRWVRIVAGCLPEPEPTVRQPLLWETVG